MSSPPRTDQVDTQPIPDVDDRDAVAAANAMAAVETFSDIHYSEQSWFDAAARRAVAAVDAARLTRLVEAKHTIPEVLADEDGESWYVKGHITPEAMVLAATVCIATECGSSDAIDTLVGVEDVTLLSYLAVRDRMVRNANTLLDSVKHLWYVDNGEERNPFVDPGTPGALPITVLAL